MLNLTPYFKIYQKYRYKILENHNFSEIQEQQLLNLVAKAKNTKFGKDHNFSSINSIEDFQKDVPLRTYENFWDEYFSTNFPNFDNLTWKGKIKYFAVSSGTTKGVTKYIPISNEMLKSNNKAGLDLMVHHLQNYPDSKIFAGKNFFLGGSTELNEVAQGVFAGDLSGIVTKTIPYWVSLRYFPNKILATIKNWEEKISKMGEASLKNNISSISGVPAWMLILFNDLLNKNPNCKSISDLYPNIEMLVHGGVNFAPYYDTFNKLLAHSQIDLREVYPASEGFIAIGDRNYGQGLKLNLDTGIFYEFVPLNELHSTNPTRHWIGNVQKNVNYAIVLTTCAGLWSYIIGDTVKFIDTKTPRILVTGRTSYYLSAFGEHLIADEIEDSIAKAASQYNLQINDYSVFPEFPKSASELGGHVYFVEFLNHQISTNDIKSFTKALDNNLCIRNEDYEAHRSKGFGLKEPKIVICPNGFFAAWMKARGKLGGQNKVPRIINNQELIDNLNDFYNNFKF